MPALAIAGCVAGRGGQLRRRDRRRREARPDAPTASRSDGAGTASVLELDRQRLRPAPSGTSSGCRMWASSSSPSMIRGPGREKYDGGVDRDHLAGARARRAGRGASRPRGGRSRRHSRTASRSPRRAAPPRPPPTCAPRSSRRRTRARPRRRRTRSAEASSGPPRTADRAIPAPRPAGGCAPRGRRAGPGRSAPRPPARGRPRRPCGRWPAASVRASPSTSPTVCGIERDHLRARCRSPRRVARTSS